MKTFQTFLTGTLAVAALCVPQALADRYSDYWKPENMAQRQCTSVHLAYLPQVNHTAAYTEMVIEKSAPGTYFACNNFDRGYIGAQELHEDKDGKTKRVVIFSVWDAKDTGDNPHAAPEEERAKLVQRGAGVITARFGGEGTGGKSMRLFPWKEGDVIRTLVVEKPDGEHFRQIAGYIYNPATQQWELLSCWRVQALHRGLNTGCGFVEDFRRNVKSKEFERRATFGPAFRWTGEKWDQAKTFRFTKDGNLNTNINCRINPERGFFSLATGGKAAQEKDFAVFTERTIEPPASVREPGEEVMKLIRAPKMEVIPYEDDGKWEE